jgi:hypothetical protein
MDELGLLLEAMGEDGEEGGGGRGGVCSGGGAGGAGGGPWWSGGIYILHICTSATVLNGPVHGAGRFVFKHVKMKV